MTTPVSTIRTAAGLDLPLVVACAADRVGAPRADWHTVGDLVTWVETSLGFMLPCCAVDPLRSRSVGAVRHWVRVDPRTEQSVATPAPDQSPTRLAVTRDKVDAMHMMWALVHTRGDQPACVRVGEALATWVGQVHPGTMAPWAPSSNGRMQAVRTMMRTAQYIDAGLDLASHEGWLGMGVHPQTLTWVRDLLNATNAPFDEAGLLRFLEHKVGMRGTLKVGQKAVTDTAWLCAVVRDWCYDLTQQPLPALPPPTR